MEVAQVLLQSLLSNLCLSAVADSSTQGGVRKGTKSKHGWFRTIRNLTPQQTLVDGLVDACALLT